MQAMWRLRRRLGTGLLAARVSAVPRDYVRHQRPLHGAALQRTHRRSRQGSETMNRRAFFNAIATHLFGATAYIYAGPLFKTPSIADVVTVISPVDVPLISLMKVDGSLAFSLTRTNSKLAGVYDWVDDDWQKRTPDHQPATPNLTEQHPSWCTCARCNARKR